jgi:two-component system response regulator FlrC
VTPRRILLVDDDPAVRDAMASFLARAGFAVTDAAGGAEALGKADGGRFDLVVSDMKMPGMTGLELLQALRGRGDATPFVLLTAYGSVETAVTAMKCGASDFLLKPFLPAQLERVIRDCFDRTAPVRPTHALSSPDPAGAVVGGSAAIREVMALARQVAPSLATVLITGESGTGKEVVARAIHAMGTPSGAPFVAVNCAAMPDGLLESELFGHEKGAFTGAAVRRQGKFEQADGGTLLLDEIGEMDIRLQAKLLRALQEKAFERVGGTAPVQVRLRVIATTNRNLRDAVRDGLFREDLFYRLNVFPIHLPPLRDRAEDVLPLAEHFASRFAAEAARPAPTFADDARDMLASLPWRGNVRELMNRVERALLLCPSGPIGATHLCEPGEAAEAGFAPASRPVAGSAPLPSPAAPPAAGSMKEVEKALILTTLRSVEGNRNRTAETLGISVRTLRNKLAEYRQLGEAIP